MSAGQFDRIIQLQSPTTTVDANGTPQKTWATYATPWAKLLQLSTQEFVLKGLGEDTEIVAAYRIRWLEGVTLAHQVVHVGANVTTTFRITDIKEIGRHEYLDLRCVAVTS